MGTHDLRRGLHMLFGAPPRRKSAGHIGTEGAEEHLTHDQLGLVIVFRFMRGNSMLF